jgi:hypothetical protein
MHADFRVFTRQFHEPLLDENTALYLNMANALCQVMPSAFDSEDHRRDAFEKIFSVPGVELTPHKEYPLSPKVSTATESGTRLDMPKTISFKGGRLVPLLEEFKEELTGDVHMQICRGFEVWCAQEQNERLLKFGNPVFLLCVAGGYQNVDPE